MLLGVFVDRCGPRYVAQKFAALLGLSTLCLATAATHSYSQGMTVPGSLGVNSSGAASYKVPISAPPSTAGMAPSLSLEYSSQGGNGLLGVGWSLGGLPSINRCPQTMAQDGVVGGINYDANDRFCMDGQRLVAVSGTYGTDGAQYRTEIDGFSKVISHGGAGSGPAWFEVHTKSGQTMEFGNTTDSRILAQGKSSARAWAVNRVSDTKANYYTVSYYNGTGDGQYFPTRIDYTGNTSASVGPYNSILFDYDSRSDFAVQYQSGSLIKSTVRLSNVRTFAGSALVANYQISYQQSPSTQRSEVVAIQICAADGACIPATTFGWQSGAGAGTFTGQTQTLPNGWAFDGKYISIVGDFRGEGKTDYLMIDNKGNPYQYVFMSNGDGTFSGQTQTLPNGLSFAGQGNYISIVGDFNGDGKTDYLLIDRNYPYIYTFFSNGDGTFSEQTQAMPNGWIFVPGANYIPVVGDFNGDGKTDFLLIDSNGNPYQYVFMNKGDGQFSGQAQNLPNGLSFNITGNTPNMNTVIVGDFNGDKKVDYVIIDSNGYPYQYVFLSNGDGTFSEQTQTLPNGWTFRISKNTPNANIPIVGDFNGDGNTDYLLIDANGYPYQYVFMSNGDGTFTGQTQNSPNGWGFGAGSYYLPIAGDFNGDGKTDFILVDLNGNPYQYLFTSKGDGTFSGQAQSLPNGWSFPINGNTPNPNYTVVGDFNGDGKTDYLLIDANAYPYQYVFTGNGQIGDLINVVSNGLGSTSTITYRPLTNSAIYTRDSTGSYPIEDVQAAIYVVSQLDTSNGIGGTYSAAYRYAGAKSDSAGRGFLGFRQMSVTDLQTNITDTTSFRQDFPFNGLVASTMRTFGGQTLTQSANTYQFSNLSGGTAINPGSAPYRLLLSQSVSGGSDLDGSALPTTTSTFQYDSYNNPTQVSVGTSDGYSKTTTNTYNNDVMNWYLGRLTRASVTSVAP